MGWCTMWGMRLRAMRNSRPRGGKGLPPSISAHPARALGGRQSFGAVLISILLCAGLDAADFSPSSMSFDELMLHASRYGTTEEKRERKRQAQEELMSRGAEALTYLLSKSHLKNMWFFIYARQLVEQLDAEEAVPVLLRGMASEHEVVKKNAIFFLGYFEQPQYTGRLMPYLKEEKLSGVTMRTLGKWKARNATRNIIPFLKDEDERRRIVAANALRDIGDPRAIPHLIDALNDQYFTVRYAVERALSRLGPAAEDAIIRAMPDADPRSLRHMVRALGPMDSDRSRQVLAKYARHKNGWVRLEAERVATDLH